MSSIFYGQTQQTLLAGEWDDDVDHKASHARYCELLTARIEAAYPGANVEVAGRSDFRCVVDFTNADDELKRVIAIARQLVDEPDEWVCRREQQAPAPITAIQYGLDCDAIFDGDDGLANVDIEASIAVYGPASRMPASQATCRNGMKRAAALTTSCFRTPTPG